MIFKFRRMRPMDPLQVAMTGVRMGERYLQIFCSDAPLTVGLAIKTGLSGVAALAAPDAKQATRARDAASKAGALIDVQIITPLTALPWGVDAFDMVVIDNTGGDVAGMPAGDRAAMLASVRQVLRAGGRVEMIERVRDLNTESEEMLRAAGFRPVRTLAEQDAFRFIEGHKG